MKNNILCQYDGGGYDGCIWEWNFFYIDKGGVFHDIHSSGTGGIETAKRAYELIDNNGNSFSNKVYIYHLDSEDELKDFATETHGSLVEGIVRWFNNYNEPDAEPFAVCNECGGYISDADEIHVVDTETICYECYSCGQCYRCEQYIGSDGLTSIDESGDAEYVCEYCIEDDDMTTEDCEDMAFVSFATGEPDMFSDEMRWYWGG